MKEPVIVQTNIKDKVPHWRKCSTSVIYLLTTDSFWRRSPDLLPAVTNFKQNVVEIIGVVKAQVRRPVSVIESL
jgi:hypothetical protein